MSDFNNENVEVTVDNEEVNLSAISKVVNIVVSPSKALKAIKFNPNLLFPMLIVMLVPVLYYVGFWSSIEVQMIRTMEAQFEVQGLEATQDMIDMSLGFARWGTPIMVVIGVLIGGVISTLYYFVCSRIAKSEVAFKQIFSLVFHVMIISVFSWILMMVLTLAGVDFMMEVPMTSLASLLPSSMNTSILYGLALPIEVFSIWGSVITYFGLRIVADMSKKASMISVILAFSFGMLISAGSFMLASLMNSLV